MRLKRRWAILNQSDAGWSKAMVRTLGIRVKAHDRSRGEVRVDIDHPMAREVLEVVRIRSAVCTTALHRARN